MRAADSPDKQSCYQRHTGVDVQVQATETERIM